MADITLLKIDSIRRDADLQPRAMMNAITIEEYREAMEALEAEDRGSTWDEFPPLHVFSDDDGHFWLADGFHRIEAAERAGLTSAKVRLERGSKRDAILYAVGANARHGLRRSDADKRKSVLTLLDDPEWGQWSDREIARRAAVSHTYVAKLREYTGNVASERTYRDRHGNVTTMDTSGIAAANEERAAGKEEGETVIAQLPLHRIDEDLLRRTASVNDGADASLVRQIVRVTHWSHARNPIRMANRGTLLAAMVYEENRANRRELVKLIKDRLSVLGQEAALDRAAERPAADDEALDAEALDCVRRVRFKDEDGEEQEPTPPSIPSPSAVPARIEAHEGPKPSIPSPLSLREQTEPALMITARIAAGSGVSNRRVTVTVGREGRGPAAFYHGDLTQILDLVRKAVEDQVPDAQGIYGTMVEMNNGDMEINPVGELELVK